MNNKTKLYIALGIAAVIAILTISVICLSNTVNKYKNLYSKELQNVEAYQIDNSDLKNTVRQYQMTIDDLYNSNDSLDQKIIAMMHELDIKDKNIKDLQYQLTQASRVDTLVLKDTLFRDDISVDTTFGDAWYNMHLQLKYPSTIITEPTFNSEQYVYIYTTKVYNTKPSKCFFINWFKKKHVVTEVKIEEKSPYIKTIKQKFIEVNK